jgi:hypothetical protein
MEHGHTGNIANAGGRELYFVSLKTGHAWELQVHDCCDVCDAEKIKASVPLAAIHQQNTVIPMDSLISGRCNTTTHP